ncbi:MAG: NAD(P)-dependent oxidoreductase [Lachnospiraceae bacterium]|jgi:UDP-glucose 4-epimerase|nr:NAD(P)-dependent oxidoreductase [Lachnospiraceae bacterium]
MKIFITGGTGCIGQYVSALSAQRGHETLVLSREPNSYAPMAQMENITLVKGEMADYDLMRQYVAGCDAVIHIALGWGLSPSLMMQNDTAITANLMEISEKAGVKKFLYTSSVAAFGHALPDIDETYACMPIDIYGSTKAASDAYVIGFCKYYGDADNPEKPVTMKRNVIRPGYTFANPLYPGATVQKDTRFRDIASAVVKNEPIHLIKHDGTQFMSSEQIAEVYLAIIESDLNEEIFMALATNFMTWEQIARMTIAEYPETKAEIVLEDKGWNSSPNLYSVDKIKRTFGLEYDGTEEVKKHIRFSLEEAMRK